MTAGCAYALIASVLIPGTRWYLRVKLLRAIERLNRSLQIQIRPIQRTKRQVWTYHVSKSCLQSMPKAMRGWCAFA
jgi:hypothetical protein